MLSIWTNEKGRRLHQTAILLEPGIRPNRTKMTWDFDGWFVPEPGMALSIAAEKVAVACGDGKADAAASFMR